MVRLSITVGQRSEFAFNGTTFSASEIAEALSQEHRFIPG